MTTTTDPIVLHIVNKSKATLETLDDLRADFSDAEAVDVLAACLHQLIDLIEREI